MGGHLWLRVQPAYGKWYETAEALRAAWDAGVDFEMQLTVAEALRGIGGTYISKRDLPQSRAVKTPLNDYTGIQIVQPKRYLPLRDGRLLRVPYFTDEVTW